MNTTSKVILALLNMRKIVAIGGMVYDSEMKLLCSTIELHSIVVDIRNTTDYRIVRVDAGGSPTWELIKL